MYVCCSICLYYVIACNRNIPVGKVVFFHQVDLYAISYNLGT